MTDTKVERLMHAQRHIRACARTRTHACTHRVTADMQKARIVAGAIAEGDPEDETQGNAGSWLDLELMLEEVRACVCVCVCVCVCLQFSA